MSGTTPPTGCWRGGRLLLFALAPLLGASLTACSNSRPISQDESAPPFVFRSLDLRQADLRGRPAWTLTSPEARYDLRRQVAQAVTPRGVIYRDGQPAYRLQASSGTVVNDGAVVLLEGQVRVEQVGRQPVLIEASRVRWFPSRQRMEIDRHPRASDPQYRLSARQATFLFDRNLLELRGKPLLERWSTRFDPFQDPVRSDPETVVRVSQADWNPSTGALQARGPVEANRRPPGRSAKDAPQNLTASALAGNTQQQQLRLLAPVTYTDSVDQARLEAREVQLDLRQHTARSQEPFQGSRAALALRGQGFDVHHDQTSVEIRSGCVISQNQDVLTAGRCRWNWLSQEVEADGDLELRRQQNRQITRGRRLRGQLGAQGSLTVSNPSGRVFSQFQVPNRPGPPRLQRPRPAAEPIRL
ncbi:MAG: LPS export ABC transporter periplasmic protein LptC [Cyanobium sp.]